MKTKDAIKHFGSKKKLADFCGVSKSAVSQWGAYVPTSQSYKLEILTKGALKAQRDSAMPEAQ